MKLRYTPESRADLRAIRTYISKALGNPDAAERTVLRLLDACADLKQFPRLGRALSGRIDRETDLRYLVCGKHLVFYRIEQESVSVVRILDGRRDYLRMLFDAASGGG